MVTTSKKTTANKKLAKSSSPPKQLVKSTLRRSPKVKGGSIDGGFSRIVVEVIRLLQGVVICFIKSTKANHYPYDGSAIIPASSGDPAADSLEIIVIGQIVVAGTDEVILGNPSKKDGNQYGVRCMVKAHNNPAENTAAAAHSWGQAVVNLYKKFSKCPVHPIVNVLNGNTAIPDLPAVNHYIRNEDAAKIAKVLYHEAIEDGSFWDHEEVVADFFGDLENPQSLFHILLDGSGDEEVEHNIVN